MTLKPDIGDDFQDLIRGVCGRVRNPSTSEPAAVAMLQLLCSMAFQRGGAATWRQVARDLDLIKAAPSSEVRQ